MNEDIKKELVRRYKFIYSNIEYLVGPFLVCNALKEKNDYIVNKRIPYELLMLGQKFLLSDDVAEFSELVKYVERRKNDLEYVKSVDIKNKKLDNKERLMWEFFNSICNLIILQEENKILRRKKLIAMDEYYKILNYQNKMGIQEQGSKLINSYLNNNKNKWYFGLGRIKEEANLKSSKFIKYISDEKNYDKISLGILSSKEKQDIYLEFHDELAWDMLVKCEVDKNNVNNPRKKHLLRQDINLPCEEEFYLIESKVFINPKDKNYKYYQVCPNCGYVVNIPEDMLSESVKTRIESRCLNDEHEFSRQLLTAELRSVDYRDDVLVKRRIRKY